MPDENKQKRNTGSRFRIESENLQADITLPTGVIRQGINWVNKNWKRAAYHASLLTMVFASVFNGISVRDMTITSKGRLTALENKAVAYDNALTKIQTLEKKVIGLEAISDEDKAMLEKQEQQERDARRRRELQKYNKDRAEKLKRISQSDNMFANPVLPQPASAPVRN
jgi:hypothetical protein